MNTNLSYKYGLSKIYLLFMALIIIFGSFSIAFANSNYDSELNMQGKYASALDAQDIEEFESIALATDVNLRDASISKIEKVYIEPTSAAESVEEGILEEYVWVINYKTSDKATTTTEFLQGIMDTVNETTIKVGYAKIKVNEDNNNYVSMQSCTAYPVYDSYTDFSCLANLQNSKVMNATVSGKRSAAGDSLTWNFSYSLSGSDYIYKGYHV